MKIKCDASNLAIKILEQECRDEDDGFYSSDDVEVAISMFPSVYYDDHDRGIHLDTIYLRGSERDGDDRWLIFKNLSDLITGIRAIQQYCDARSWDFESDFNVERVVLYDARSE